MTFALAADCPSNPLPLSASALTGDVVNLWSRFSQLSGSRRGVIAPEAGTSVALPETLEERLNAAKRNAKVELSKVAARIAPNWRENLFWQLDALLDPDEWDENDSAEMLSIPSWKCFLKALFVLRSGRRPGLGLTDSGNIVASWSRGAEHLDIEFRPDDHARWVLAAEGDEGMERAAGRTSIFRLPEVLAPYSPDRWFVA